MSGWGNATSQGGRRAGGAGVDRVGRDLWVSDRGSSAVGGLGFTESTVYPCWLAWLGTGSSRSDGGSPRGRSGGITVSRRRVRPGCIGGGELEDVSGPFRDYWKDAKMTSQGTVQLTDSLQALIDSGSIRSTGCCWEASSRQNGWRSSGRSNRRFMSCFGSGIGGAEPEDVLAVLGRLDPARSVPG